MKRSVKFRGYCEILKKWIYGSLVVKEASGKNYIHYQNEMNLSDYELVVPDSVGQEAVCGIYEGDILKLNVSNSDDLYIVEWHDAGFMARRLNKPTSKSYSREYIGLCNYFDIIEVVGNAFEMKIHN